MSEKTGSVSDEGAGGPDDIVGHKTFDTGERDEHGLPKFRHEPLTRAEGDALWAAAEKAKAERNARMPDEKAALNAMHDAWVRLKDFGWREAIYCPKDGSSFQVIEAGSTGIFDCNYHGEWPDGSWWVHDAHDTYPSHPILFRLYPEDQAKYMRRGLKFAVGKAVEELGELQAALGKTLRWGWFSVNPELPEKDRVSNCMWVRSEIADVRNALDNLEKELFENEDDPDGAMFKDFRT